MEKKISALFSYIFNFLISIRKIEYFSLYRKFILENLDKKTK